MGGGAEGGTALKPTESHAQGEKLCWRKETIPEESGGIALRGV